MTRTPWVVLLAASALVSSGCRALVELVEADGEGGAADAAMPGGADARGDGGDCQPWSFQPAHVDPCSAPRGGALVLVAGDWTYDTNSGVLTDPDQNATIPGSALVSQASGPEVRVLAASSVELAAGATLVVEGSRPLVLVSWADIEIAGQLFASSGGGRVGAGADPSLCASGAAEPGVENADGASGGGGGGFGASGAAGGAGRDLAVAGGGGGAAVALPGYVRGGCPGAVGGNSLAGAGGAGGGALQLTAQGAIRIDGVVHAGGAGGGASQGLRSGGGGGGSGGLIDLDAPAITVGAGAVLAANGGGGGGGSDGSPASPGQDGQPSADPALAGAGQGMGDDGGAGGAGGQAAEPGVDSSRGGGGGGGGVGFIVLHGPSTTVDPGAVISPPPS